MRASVAQSVALQRDQYVERPRAVDECNEDVVVNAYAPGFSSGCIVRNRIARSLSGWLIGKRASGSGAK
ncbi:hypothetical protein BW21_1662 [Burkholderia humptydooensis]|nr:hypothetical protein BW21_1662 [Burkholderia sp. 2002721687]ALX42311.1 hypothetical protein AQ610_07685 [Burkholderia humptydooensis]